VWPVIREPAPRCSAVLSESGTRLYARLFARERRIGDESKKERGCSSNENGVSHFMFCSSGDREKPLTDK
jgi:hypothetical protein